MIDIHAHILPGVDDGAENLDSALEMATLAVESGVTTLVATPHCVEFSRQSNLWGSELIHRIRDFQQALNNARGKDHLRSTGNAQGSGALSVPAEEMAMFRLFNPNATEAEIQKFYNKHHKR